MWVSVTFVVVCHANVFFFPAGFSLLSVVDPFPFLGNLATFDTNDSIIPTFIEQTDFYLRI